MNFDQKPLGIVILVLKQLLIYSHLFCFQVNTFLKEPVIKDHLPKKTTFLVSLSSFSFTDLNLLSTGTFYRSIIGLNSDQNWIRIPIPIKRQEWLRVDGVSTRFCITIWIIQWLKCGKTKRREGLEKWGRGGLTSESSLEVKDMMVSTTSVGGA